MESVEVVVSKGEGGYVAGLEGWVEGWLWKWGFLGGRGVEGVEICTVGCLNCSYRSNDGKIHEGAEQSADPERM